MKIYWNGIFWIDLA
uniref:Uncharacterized protein n=1 Tax=Arundo donax TaxID=35708 RepID=A0A0A9BNY4_ARUDO